MIILACGSRHWKDMAVIEDFFSQYNNDSTFVITGGAPGADTLVKEACDKLSIHCAVMTALWNTRHRSAGPQRNAAMGILVGWNRIDLGVAFHDDITNSKGTLNMISHLNANLVKVEIIGS